MQAKHYKAFAEALVQWFLANGKDYPWRRTTDPWAILVSEVMLQQTTIPTVLARYESWMQQFPTPAALAAADEQTALRSWEGLGYYRRVRSLRAAAVAITEQFDGIFPQQEADLRRLPGIGDYTCGAVLSFAYNIAAPLVDANVSRVFARLFNDSTPIDSPTGRKKQWQQARELVHTENPRAYNSALMELGQTICTGNAPNCANCPIHDYCEAETPEALPVKLPKPEILRTEHHDIWCLTPAGLLLAKQPDGKRHEGMYRLPQRSATDTASLPLLRKQQYSVTRYKVTRYLYAAPTDTQPAEHEVFVPLHELQASPMASPDRKLILTQLNDLL